MGSGPGRNRSSFERLPCPLHRGGVGDDGIGAFRSDCLVELPGLGAEPHGKLRIDELGQTADAPLAFHGRRHLVEAIDRRVGEGFGGHGLATGKARGCA